MTTTTTSSSLAPPRDRDRDRGRGPRGLAWLVLRQHRAAVWTFGVALLVLLSALGTLYLSITDYVADHGLADVCTAGWACAPDGTIGAFSDELADPVHYIGRVVECLPVLFGMFVAGPLIARELHSGTYKLAWTQSVSPLRWLAAKLAVPATAVLAGFSLLSAAYTSVWRAQPLPVIPGQWWWRSFPMIGVVPVAHALLALALGAVAGLLLKRTVPAMGAVLVAYPVIAGLLESLRGGLVGPVTELSAEMPGLIRGSDDWVTGRGMIGQGGGRMPEPDCGIGVDPADCLAQHHARGWYVDYHPASHLWPLQWAEAGLSLALAALLAGGAVWLVRRQWP
ncbi:hypothetical protein [Streptomyces cinnamoneus]|uniref:ABC transporter permease n=1 Tax=Streptomyces cinnamoneus TaxID=53446 RepID=A0A918WRG8_STRCJ|nr:hypothetical protein [Streptomyces cinnamoneus]GHC73927.1 hypothetical protein GCM10010507_61580 [Streptomyces cinnamoneus]